MSAPEPEGGNANAAPPGLVWVTDTVPGIRRLRRGKGFVYRLPDGRWLSDESELRRIRSLAIPPAYTDVWICPLPHGHLQATGRDARGRKQYRYHTDWRSARDEDKFDRFTRFGALLPCVRRRVDADLRAGRAAPTRDAVLAALVRLLDTTLLRIGNDEYVRQNRSFGLTTLRNRHAAVQGSTLRLRFRGKSGVLHDVTLADPRVARIVRACQALPGQELFQWCDAQGCVHRIGSADVNAYLRQVSGESFTAKDFRTWHASALALSVLCERRAAPPAIGELLSIVARRLGNTPAVCRKSYVHPRVLALAAAPDEALLQGLAPLSYDRRMLALLRETDASAAAARRRAGQPVTRRRGAAAAPLVPGATQGAVQGGLSATRPR